MRPNSSQACSQPNVRLITATPSPSTRRSLLKARAVIGRAAAGRPVPRRRSSEAARARDDYGAIPHPETKQNARRRQGSAGPSSLRAAERRGAVCAALTWLPTGASITSTGGDGHCRGERAEGCPCMDAHDGGWLPNADQSWAVRSAHSAGECSGRIIPSNFLHNTPAHSAPSGVRARPILATPAAY